MSYEAGEEQGKEFLGKERGGKVRRRRKRVEGCHLLSARNRHSHPPLHTSAPVLPPHCLFRSSPRVLLGKTAEPKCTSSRTITTSILNKITPAVPVWLMGCVREQRRADKPPAAFHVRWALSIGEELPGELSQTSSPQEHTGTRSRNI